MQFGLTGLPGRIGSKIGGQPSPQYQRNAAYYQLHYLTIGGEYEYFFKDRYKGFSLSVGPKLYFQIYNKHRRAYWLETFDVIALPIEDKQRRLNTLAAQINVSVAYSILIKSIHLSVGLQSAVRMRSFYSDIPIGNRYLSRGLFLGVLF